MTKIYTKLTFEWSIVFPYVYMSHRLSLTSWKHLEMRVVLFHLIAYSSHFPSVVYLFRRLVLLWKGNISWQIKWHSVKHDLNVVFSEEYNGSMVALVSVILCGGIASVRWKNDGIVVWQNVPFSLIELIRFW